MAQEIINIGNVANDGAGDPLRLAFQKINNNFTQLYSIEGGAGAAQGVDGSVQFRTANNLKTVAYSNNVWVAFSSPNKYYVSYDGVIWTETPSPSAYQIYAVYPTPVGFIAVGAHGTIITSVDNGVTWATENTGIITDLYAVNFVASTNTFMAVGAGGVILTSPDATNWIVRPSGVVNNLYAVVYDTIAPRYVVVGSAGIVLLSAFGSSWTVQSSGVSTNLLGVTWDGTTYVATGSNGVIVRSLNGITWLPSASTTTQNLTAVSVANLANTLTFVTVGSNGVSLTSSDGAAITWTAIPTGTTSNLADIAYGNGFFYAVGDNGAIISTANIANGWTNTSIPGSLNGDANFTYDAVTGTLSVPNLDVANLTANVYTSNILVANQLVVNDYANLGDIGNIYIGGGNANSVLSTDGNGNLTWVPGLEPGGPNLAVQFVNNDAFDGSSSFTYNPTTDTVFSNNAVTSNIEVTNLVVSNVADFALPSNIAIGGGSNGYVLTTDGGGNLSWTPGPSANIQSLPPVYFTASYGNTGQQFTDVVLADYQSNADMTVFLNGKLLQYQNYLLNGNTMTVLPYLAAGDRVDVIRSFVAGANVSYSNANVAAFLATYNGNLTANNIVVNNSTTTGIATFSSVGNVYIPGGSANYVLTTDGAGNLSWTPGSGNSTYSNANVANYLPTYRGDIGNLSFAESNNSILSGDLNTAYLKLQSGEVRLADDLGNVEIWASGNVWKFDETGNLTLPLNTSGIYYPNGAPYATGGGNYSNANVANYLPTYGGNIAANNITVAGNVVGNVNGLVHGIDIRYLVFDFAYLQPNTYNNPIQYLLATAGTGNVEFGTFTAPAPLNIDFGTF